MAWVTLAVRTVRLEPPGNNLESKASSLSTLILIIKLLVNYLRVSHDRSSGCKNQDRQRRGACLSARARRELWSSLGVGPLQGSEAQRRWTNQRSNNPQRKTTSAD